MYQTWNFMYFPQKKKIFQRRHHHRDASFDSVLSAIVFKLESPKQKSLLVLWSLQCAESLAWYPSTIPDCSTWKAAKLWHRRLSAVKAARLLSLRQLVWFHLHAAVFIWTWPLSTLLAAGCKHWQHLKDHLKRFANQFSMLLYPSEGGSLFPLSVFLLLAWFLQSEHTFNPPVPARWCCQSAILTHKRALSGFNWLYCACPASKQSISSNARAFRTKHTWGNIPRGKSSISFMAFLWESFLLSNQASSLPLFSLHYISICISFWFTSENYPLRPINFNHFAFAPSFFPPRDNWSELENGISASARWDKIWCNWLHSAPSIWPSAAINLNLEDPHRPGDLPPTSRETCNWALKLRFSLEGAESVPTCEKSATSLQSSVACFCVFSLCGIWFIACLLRQHAQWNPIFPDKRGEAVSEDFRCYEMSFTLWSSRRNVIRNSICNVSTLKTSKWKTY